MSDGNIVRNPQNADQKFIFSAYLLKMKGGKRTSPLPTIAAFDLFISWLGAFTGIGAVTFLTLHFDLPLLVASFGASAVLIYGVPDAPLAQPRNVIGGHIISAVIGVTVYYFFGLSWWSVALGCALSIVAMLLTNTTHPPGGATGLIAVWTQQSPAFIVAPVALGTVILVIVGVITNNLSPRRHYPKYWI